MNRLDPKIAQARRLIAQASRIAVLTGAGVSAESGIPTFRGEAGLWRNFRPEDLATPQAFERDPKLVWEWYDWRRGIIAQANPNAAHLALAELERAKEHFTLITQNVDGLHDRAGSQNVLKLHGDIWTIKCSKCGRERQELQVPLTPLPLRCACGALERPGVVWFGEPLPEKIWQQAVLATREAELLLVVGTSAVVHPAAGLVQLAASAGATIIEINPEKSAISALATHSIQTLATEALASLCGAGWQPAADWQSAKSTSL